MAWLFSLGDPKRSISEHWSKSRGRLDSVELCDETQKVRNICPKLSEKRSISLNVSSCWWLICSWWCAGIGAMAMGKSATVLSLWVPSMAINWLPAALGRGTTDASNWKASSSSAKPIPTESGRASVDFWTYSEQMWTWKGEEEGCSGGKDLLTLLNLTRDGTEAQISPLKAGFCKRLLCEYLNDGVKWCVSVRICLCVCMRLCFGVQTSLPLFAHSICRRVQSSWQPHIKWHVITATKPFNYVVITFYFSAITISVRQQKISFHPMSVDITVSSWHSAAKLRHS